MAEPKRRRPRRHNEPYRERTNAICVTIYDIHGNVITDDLATRTLHAISEAIADHRGLAISFTRT